MHPDKEWSFAELGDMFEAAAAELLGAREFRNEEDADAALKALAQC